MQELHTYLTELKNTYNSIKLTTANNAKYFGVVLAEQYCDLLLQDLKRGITLTELKKKILEDRARVIREHGNLARGAVIVYDRVLKWLKGKEHDDIQEPRNVYSKRSRERSR